jgi:hypothetical protein
MHEPKGNCIGAHAIHAPLLRDGLCDAKDGGLRSCIVHLADVTVEARGGGDIDDGAVFAGFGLGEVG